MFNILFLLLSLTVSFQGTLGDGVDWIDPIYVKSYPSRRSSETAKAAHGIVTRARSSAKNGPFTVTKGNINAPSGKEQDYLSWAPYHWPDCNWCKSRGSGNGPKQADYDENVGSNGTDSSGRAPLGDQDGPLDDDFLPDVTNQLLLYSVEIALPTQVASLAVREEGDSTQDITSHAASITPAVSPIPPQLPDRVERPTSEEAIEGNRRPAPTASSACTPSPTTSMAPSATWTKCPYKAIDGKVNPDRNQLYGLSQLNAFAQSTVDNALASVLENDPDAAKNAANFIDAFLLHPKTGMLPTIPWGQTLRGPSQRGSYMGILDFRVMIKVVNAVQILRVTGSPVWTSDRDGRMIKWAKTYINWLETSELGMRPQRSANNHSSFYYGQLAALKILVGDEPAALKAVQAYFSGPFREQILSSGEQPFESTRTKPFHYRCFNLQAMVATAKLGDYLGVDMWTAQTKYKSTIKTAVDYIISLDPGHEDSGDAFPLVAAARVVYGDDQKATYRRYLENGGNKEPKKSSSYPYKTKTWWFYQQPEALKHTPLAAHKRDLPWNARDEGLYSYAPGHEVMGNLPPFAPAFNTVAVDAPSKPVESLLSSPSVVALHLPPPTMSAADEHPTSGGTTTPSSSASCATSHSRVPNQAVECVSAVEDRVPAGETTTSEEDVAGQLPIIHPERPAPFASTDAVELDEGIFVYWWQIRHLYEQSDDQTKRSAWARW